MTAPNRNARVAAGVEGAADFGLRPNHNILLDERREAAIRAVIHGMNVARSPNVRRAFWERAKRLILARSPAQVAALERARGLL